MKLSKKNWLVRWAYLAEVLGDSTDKIPDQTNVCALFFRTFWFTPVVVVPMSIVFCAIAGPFVLIGWIFRGNRRWVRSTKEFEARMNTSWTSSLIYQRLADFKNRTCTMIDLD